MAIKVSVLMPAHNAAEFIAGAMRSALDQTLRDIELIVIDDASTDNTAEVAMRAAGGDPRFVLLRCPANIGPGPARNLGIDHASGEWIALLDADDSFAPERLESMVRLAQERGADMVADNLRISKIPGSAEGFNAIRNDFMSRKGRISAADFIAMDRPSYGTQAVGFLKPLMRTEFLRRNALRYDGRFRNGEDFHLYVRALLLGARMFVTPEAWYRYLFRGDSQCRGLEASFPQQLIAGNEDLWEFAARAREESAARELRRRRKEIDCWIPYSSFVAALKNRQRARAMKSFFTLPSRAYAVRKLWEAVMRRVQKAPEVSLMTR